MEKSEGGMRVRIALTGDVALDLLAPYFREAGYEVYVPAGFGTWQQELLNPASGLHRFKPDYIYDVPAAAALLAGEIPNFTDERLAKLAALPYSLAGIHALVEELWWRTHAEPRKILAVDADNTLWQGILSEDGAAALKPYEEFQRALLALRDEGVTLVLLTKNDVFEFRADMPLKSADFGAVRMNWAPKAGNLIEACRELNLSTDSVVFLDDNPYERAQMTAHLPEVMTVPFTPPPTATLIRRLRQYFFAQMGQTEEDRLRAADYAHRRLAPLPSAFQSVADYLASLDLRVEARTARTDDLDRLAQMAGKTNQFNSTTHRFTRADFERILANPMKQIFVYRTADRFGVQGIVSYVIYDALSDAITEWVMSCRAMGRTLEYFVTADLIQKLGYLPAIDFDESPKNQPFRLFLDGNKMQPTAYQEAVV